VARVSDRLEEIKKRYCSDGQIEDDTVNDLLLDLGTWPITQDINWLIGETERLITENEQQEKIINIYWGNIQNLAKDDEKKLKVIGWLIDNNPELLMHILSEVINGSENP
jgi:hypothetical protein